MTNIPRYGADTTATHGAPVIAVGGWLYGHAAIRI